MSECDCYDKLAEALDRLPNGYPRTSSGVEVRLLEEIFSPDEASIAAGLGREYEDVDALASRLGRNADELRNTLVEMAKRGLVWFDKRQRRPWFRLAPFIVGIYEAQLDVMDEEMARLFDGYMHEGGAEGLLMPQPALQRVVPGEGSVPPEWILPYDDVRALLLEANTFRLRDCICRKERRLAGKCCEAPMLNCLMFSKVKRPQRPDDITRDEALAPNWRALLWCKNGLTFWCS